MMRRGEAERPTERREGWRVEEVGDSDKEAGGVGAHIVAVVWKEFMLKEGIFEMAGKGFDKVGAIRSGEESLDTVSA